MANDDGQTEGDQRGEGETETHQPPPVYQISRKNREEKGRGREGDPLPFSTVAVSPVVAPVAVANFLRSTRTLVVRSHLGRQWLGCEECRLASYQVFTSVRWKRQPCETLGCKVRERAFFIFSAFTLCFQLYDIRAMKELESFRGHRKDVTALAWRPFHEEYFVSGSLDGSIFHWLICHKTPQVEIPNAHDNSVWVLAWHPIGYILFSGSNDHTTKFWCRNRPGDPARDKFNVGHSQGYGEQNPALAGCMPSNFPGLEPPTTPGPFAAGLARNDGTIPGVEIAMPLSIPSLDTSAQGDQRPPLAVSMPLGAPPLPPGPHPSLLAGNQQQAYQQNAQQIQNHQPYPKQMTSFPFPPPYLPQLHPPSNLPLLSHPHLPCPQPQLNPLGMPSNMPSSIPMASMPTSLPMPMPMPGQMD